MTPGDRAAARTSIHTVLDRARAGLDRLTPLEAMTATTGGARLVDVRRREQVLADGRIPGALEISLNVLEWRLDPDSSSRLEDAPSLPDLVIVVCDEGYCSSLAAARLQELGFRRATDVIGGFQAWRTAGLPVVNAS